jgi:hypothetical protein
VANAGLPRSGIADLDVFQLQHLGRAGLVKSDGFGHVMSPACFGVEAPGMQHLQAVAPALSRA